MKLCWKTTLLQREWRKRKICKRQPNNCCLYNWCNKMHHIRTISTMKRVVQQMWGGLFPFPSFCHCRILFLRASSLALYQNLLQVHPYIKRIFLQNAPLVSIIMGQKHMTLMSQFENEWFKTLVLGKPTEWQIQGGFSCLHCKPTLPDNCLHSYYLLL